MTTSPPHDHTPEILSFPPADSLVDARLDALHTSDADQTLVLDYRELRLHAAPDVVMRDGRLLEHLRGEYVPRRLRFEGVHNLRQTGVYE
ncbi:MAG: hypothetical protein GYB65_06885 [Chloroflexi bacterium]|nr:hypothetical protein [Chloroflexota bacterium]